MCGISGIWNYRSGQAADRERLRAITEIIAHRGPDGEGYYWGPGPGLGHRRLSIIDLERGQQPMANEDQTVWIVFNGEIYNFPELRDHLLGRGHVFRTHSDTEAILHLYEEYGESCFEKLRGMFALALWDNRNQKLLLARDRLGIKPLFYGLGDEGIVFGSELKCVRASRQVDLAVEPTAIVDLFTYFYIPGPKTIYKNIFSLEPGYYLAVSRQGLRKQRYWDLTGEQLQLSGEEEYQERLYGVLQDAVKCHLLSDVPLGAFLSGGVDSSIVVALMSGLMKKPVMTCSIGFQEEQFNELPRARVVAEIFRTDHNERVITPQPAKVLEQLANFYDQPFPDHSSMPTYYVSQLARQRVKVVLSGDGGDENFAGYSRYRRHLTLERIRRALGPLHTLLRPLRACKGNRGNGILATRLLRVMHQLSSDAREGYLHAITVADRSLRQSILSPDLKHETAGYDPLDVFRDIYDRAPARDPLAKIFYLDLKTYLVDDILTKVDRASMANSLEVRVPLLDHRVVEFAYSLPLSLKIADGRGKHLLRQTIRQCGLGRHLDLQKKGFNIPFVAWLRGDLRPWAEDIIFNADANASYLSAAGVEQAWHRFQQGGSHLAELMGILLSFSLSAPLWSSGQVPKGERAAVS